jgi:hypothetical protein
LKERERGVREKERKREREREREREKERDIEREIKINKWGTIRLFKSLIIVATRGA